MSKHGGKRTPGKGKRLGRPPKENAKVAVSGRVSPDVAEYLREAGLSDTVEQAVRQSKAFREWNQAKAATG